MAACYIELKQLDESMKVLEEAIKAYNDTPFKERKYEDYAKILARKARIYHIKKDFNESINWYENSLMENSEPKVS